MAKHTLNEKTHTSVYNALITNGQITTPEILKGLKDELTLNNGCIFREIKLFTFTFTKTNIGQTAYSIAYIGNSEMKELAR